MDGVINPHNYNFNQFSTGVDCRTWLHVPSGTHWSTNSDTHQVVEIQCFILTCSKNNFYLGKNNLTAVKIINSEYMGNHRRRHGHGFLNSAI